MLLWMHACMCVKLLPSIRHNIGIVHANGQSASSMMLIQRLVVQDAKAGDDSNIKQY